MSAVILALKLAIELLCACHCSRWVTTDHGMRCVEPLEHARCELVSGWHAASYGVLVCSKGCEE